MDLIMKIRQLVVALKANDWATSALLAMSLLDLIVKALTAPPSFGAADAPPASFRGKDNLALADDLDALCNKYAAEVSVGAPSTAFLENALPILWEVGRNLLRLQ